MKGCVVSLWLLLMFCCSECARILGIYPVPAPSHKIVLTSLLRELATRGHDVTVISPYFLNDTPPNYKQIITGVDLKTTMGSEKSNTTLFDVGEMYQVVLNVFLWDMGIRISEHTLKAESVQKFLNDTRQEYDLIILEYFYNEALLGFVHRYKVPVIGVCTFAGTESIGGTVGDPYPYSYIPNVYFDYNDHMTLFQRLHNTLINVFVKIGRALYYLPKQEEIMRKYFADENLPSIRELECNTSLVMFNDHFSYSFPKPRVPNAIEVGGMHVKPPRKLPQNLQTYLDNSVNGFIYFSMGSNLKSAEMHLSKKEAFLRAFSRVKVNILWKFEDMSLLGLPKNIKIEKWLPQSDILGHPKIRAFITHGGLLSTQEAIYNGVPLIGIPMFADQKLNVKRAVASGYAILLNYKNVTEDSIYWAIQEITENPKYRNKMKELSRIYHDQPETPMERAVFWTEYVIRHKGAVHMRNASLHLAWYQYYLLDVIALLIFGVFAIVRFLVTVTRKITERTKIQRTNPVKRD